VSARFGPMGLQDAQLHGLGFGFEHASVALLGGQTFGGALDVENVSARGEQSAQLLSLDAADVFVVRRGGKYRDRKKAAQLGNIVGVVVQQRHSNAGSGGGVRHMRMGARTGRFEQDRVGQRNGSRLDARQQLLTLHDALVVGIDDLEINAQFLAACRAAEVCSIW